MISGCLQNTVLLFPIPLSNSCVKCKSPILPFPFFLQYLRKYNHLHFRFPVLSFFNSKLDGKGNDGGIPANSG